MFDCNCSFGESARPAFRYARTASDLAEEMEFCGIERAVVRYAGMRYGPPDLWNGRLVADIRGHANMQPAWAILPSQTGEQPEPEEFIDGMRANGVRVLWAFPDEHRYRLDGRTFGPLIELLIERRIPLFIKQNLVAIGDLMAEFPELTAVAVNQGPHSVERYLRPLMDTYPNLYIETSYYIVDGLIEDFCARYGAKRLLFGSGFPDNCSGGAILRLAHADIGDEARNAIAGENLDRLLSEVRL